MAAVGISLGLTETPIPWKIDIEFAHLTCFWIEVSFSKEIWSGSCTFMSQSEVKSVFILSAFHNLLMQPRPAVCSLPFELLPRGAARSEKGLQYPTPRSILAVGRPSKTSKPTSDFWPLWAWSSGAWQSGCHRLGNCHFAGKTYKGVCAGEMCNSAAKCLNVLFG